MRVETGVMADCTVPSPETINGAEAEAGSGEEEETVSFRVVWKKKNFDVTFGLDKKVSELKEHIQRLTSIPPAMMKLMYKGMVKNELTLRELRVTPGAKMMVVGSTIDDVIEVQPPSSSQLKELQKEADVPPQELLSEHKDHKKIIEKGKPDDVPQGYKNRHEPLPASVSGMVNKYGTKVRLHFKLELEQLWIGTHERTEKVPFGSIKKVVSEPIKGHEEYHILALQLGPTELSRYWVYWVPAQYVEAIKDIILGKWQYF